MLLESQKEKKQQSYCQIIAKSLNIYLFSWLWWWWYRNINKRGSYKNVSFKRWYYALGSC